MSDADPLVLPVEAVRDGVNSDPEFAIAGRYWNARIRFYSNEADEYFMQIENGSVTDFHEGSGGYPSSTLYVGGPRRTWHQVLTLSANDGVPAPTSF